MTMDVDGTRDRGPPRKIWWDVVTRGYESLGLSVPTGHTGLEMEKENQGSNWLTDVHLKHCH